MTDLPAAPPQTTDQELVRSVSIDQVVGLLHGTGASSEPVLVTGLPAAPGSGSGRLAVTVDAALDVFDQGDDPVFVAAQTSPADEPAMRIAAAVLTARGGMASHAAVVARNLGVPAVCGAEAVVVHPDGIQVGERFVAEGEWLTVDGTTGEVRVGRSDTSGPVASLPARLAQVLDAADSLADRRPAVLANADTGEDARLARSFGAQGVGLCRTEHLFLGDRLPLLQSVLLSADDASLHELERRQRADLTDLLEAMDGLPVTVRLLDPPLHEFLPRPGDPGATPELLELASLWREENPMLGVRGIRLGLLRPELVHLQIRALTGAAEDRRRAGGDPRPQVLVPMVAFVGELTQVVDWVRRAPGGGDIPVGAMVETPRAALVAGELARSADFLSFGTNDLTQLVLGFSRDDVEARLLPAYRQAGILTASPFERLDPAVVTLMARAVRAAQLVKPDLPIGMCGEQAGDAASVAMVRDIGVGSVSCSAYRVPVARLAAAHAALDPGKRCLMGIVDEDIAHVREATDLVAVVSGYTQLRKVGQRWTGLCPFHSEKSPSFSVNQADGLYHCFGCKASGDSITFVREMEHLDFPGAVEWLAGKAGITLRYTEKNESEGRRRQSRLFELTERAADWYHDRLRTAPDAAAARGYLRSRGFDADEVAHYRIGWAPDDWDQLVRSMKAPQADLEAAGLGFLNRRGRMQDFFRGRVLFPILDERSRVIGFGGRKLPDTDGPKYQNSRDNELYNKSKALYAINWAKADIVAQDEVLICEGYTDVIGFARAGINRAVATCGTALTEDHVKQLKRFTRHLVLAYDADEAGQSAADRVYAWEKAHEIQVSVVALPDGLDPDELARTDPDALTAAVKGARPFLEFRVDRVLASADLRGNEGRARAAEAALEVVAEHPDELVRDQYVMQLADTCRINASRLRDRLEVVRRTPRPVEPVRRRFRDHSPPDEPPDGPAPRRLPPLHDGVEQETLRLAIHHPELAAPFLDERFFLHPTALAALGALLSSDTLAEAIEQSPPEVGEVLARLSVETMEADPTDVLARFASEVGRRTLAELEAEARSADDPLAYADVVAWMKVTLDQLRRPRAEVETVTQLLAFLGDRHQQ